jgi:hypothetical protein
MNELTPERKRIYRLYLPLTILLALQTFWRLGFFAHRKASKSALFGLYQGFPGRNGDHMYYTSMAIQFSGKHLGQALTTAGQIFKDYPLPANKSLTGYLDPGFAPLIYPRQVLTQILSWGYRLFGAAGFGISTLLIGVSTLVLLIRWTYREWGSAAAWFALATALGSTAFVWYSSGIFIESPLLLIEAVFLYSLPISRHYQPHRYWKFINVILIVAMAFTRQSPLLPLAILIGGYCAALLKSKKITNEWFSHAVIGSLTAIAAYFAVSIWAPYSPVGLNKSHHPSLLAGVKYLAHFFASDPVIFIALVGAVLATRKLASKVLSWIALGVFLSCLINVYLATGEYRYWIPLAIFIVPLAGFFAADRLGLAQEPRTRAPKPYLALYLTVFLTALIAISSGLFYARGDGQLLLTSPVSTLYPESSLHGSLACYGPEARIYLLQSGKKVAAIDGTAMSANPGMSNQLSGLAHGLTFDRLENFAAQCVALGSR